MCRGSTVSSFIPAPRRGARSQDFQWFKWAGLVHDIELPDSCEKPFDDFDHLNCDVKPAKEVKVEWDPSVFDEFLGASKNFEGQLPCAADPSVNYVPSALQTTPSDIKVKKPAGKKRKHLYR
eukprot:c16763_g1_i1 orf=3-365(-)